MRPGRRVPRLPCPARPLAPLGHELGPNAKPAMHLTARHQTGLLRGEPFGPQGGGLESPTFVAGGEQASEEEGKPSVHEAFRQAAGLEAEGRRLTGPVTERRAPERDLARLRPRHGRLGHEPGVEAPSAVVRSPSPGGLREGLDRSEGQGAHGGLGRARRSPKRPGRMRAATRCSAGLEGQSRSKRARSRSRPCSVAPASRRSTQRGAKQPPGTSASPACGDRSGGRRTSGVPARASPREQRPRRPWPPSRRGGAGRRQIEAPCRGRPRGRA